MPLLRSYDEPSLQTIGEAVDFFGQLFEVISSNFKTKPSVTSSLTSRSILQGLQYMHEHHVAHRYVTRALLILAFPLTSVIEIAIPSPSWWIPDPSTPSCITLPMMS